MAQRLPPRLILGIVRVVLHILVGLFIVAVSFSFSSAARRERLIRWWSVHVLGVLGVRLRVHGEMASASGSMLLLNHISWIDVYVVHAVRPARFVAKSEIRNWPVIGYLCDRTGTIFIERGRRRAVHQANHAVADILRGGGFVGIFPEGTTTDGSKLLPFHANLIQAAIDAGVPVQPAALRYCLPNGEATIAAAYIDDMTLADSIRAIILGAPLLAEIHLLPAIATTGRTRHEVAELARKAIAAPLGIDLNAEISPRISLGAGAAGRESETVPGLPDGLL